MFNPSRLTLARKRRGRSKKDLAESAGLTRRTISKYESGEAEPSAKSIQRLAKELRYPVGFFSGPTIETPSLRSVSFRALSAMRASQRDSCIGQAGVAECLLDWIVERYTLPATDIPDVERYTNPESVADAVRMSWGLGERPIKNMVHLLEAHGVHVFSLSEEGREVDAFSYWRSSSPIVFLNTLKSAERGRMDAAHELGHLVMHRHGGPRGREAEREADAFASALLMPRGSVLASKPRAADIRALVKMKRKWNVSAAALNYRLHAVGLITDHRYRSNCIEMAKRGFNQAEPNGIERETSQVLHKVFRDLRRDGVAVSDVAAELCITTEELTGLVFGLERELRHLPGGGEPGDRRPTPHPLKRVK